MRRFTKNEFSYVSIRVGEALDLTRDPIVDFLRLRHNDEREPKTVTHMIVITLSMHTTERSKRLPKKRELREATCEMRWIQKKMMMRYLISDACGKRDRPRWQSQYCSSITLQRASSSKKPDTTPMDTTQNAYNRGNWHTPLAAKWWM
jgi:hypothetical protein